MRYVWDPFIRICHWSLVIAFGIAFYTHASEWDRVIHVKAGYVAGTVIIARIICFSRPSKTFCRPQSCGITRHLFNARRWPHDRDKRLLRLQRWVAF
jgi:cytochrome b